MIAHEGGLEDKISSGSTVMLHDNFMTSSQGQITDQNFGPKFTTLNEPSPKAASRKNLKLVKNDEFFSALSTAKA